MLRAYNITFMLSQMTFVLANTAFKLNGFKKRIPVVTKNQISKYTIDINSLVSRKMNKNTRRIGKGKKTKSKKSSQKNRRKPKKSSSKKRRLRKR